MKIPRKTFSSKVTVSARIAREDWVKLKRNNVNVSELIRCTVSDVIELLNVKVEKREVLGE